MIATDTVLSDLHITLWREQMAQRERAERAESRAAELEAELAEIRSAETDAPR